MSYDMSLIDIYDLTLLLFKTTKIQITALKGLFNFKIGMTIATYQQLQYQKVANCN